jgi:phospholipase C
MSRRRFLAAAGGAGAALVAPAGARATAEAVWRASARPRLPPPARSGLDHIVVLTMENRSFDHLLGWLPGADGRQAGLSYKDGHGVSHATYPLAPDFRGCGSADPDHTNAGGLVEWNHGRCDGFMRGNNGFAIGYYRRGDLPFLGRAAPIWTVCDRYFSAIMAPTMPNRIYLNAGVTDRLDTSTGPSTLPTIWDRLADKKVPARYYSLKEADSVLERWSPRDDGIVRSGDAFFADCKAGRLPAVAYFDPEPHDSAKAQDDHPFVDVRAGESMMARVYNAVVTSPNWPRTLLVINFDEWGGFFDHVPPPRARDVRPEYTLRGFRVPALLISPFARRRHVSHKVFDHASVLRTIEWRWSLAPLSLRDAHAGNLAAALDFSQRNLHAPTIDVPALISSRNC